MRRSPERPWLIRCRPAYGRSYLCIGADYKWLRYATYEAAQESCHTFRMADKLNQYEPELDRKYGGAYHND
jgi:hypothetical protein